MDKHSLPTLLAAVAVVAAIVIPAAAAPTTTKKPAVGVRGATQMAGADGVFGQTYTLKSGFNYTVVSAEYSVTRSNAYDCTVPKAEEKVVLLHVRIKNSAADDSYFDDNAHGWTAVDGDGEDHAGGTDYGRTTTGKAIVPTLKPGQGYDDVFTSILVPSKGPIVKLILNNGRMGTTDDVIRFNIGTGKNVIAPLPNFVCDPGDTSNVTALMDVPGKVGAFYPMGTFDVRFDSFQFSDGPVDGNNADEGKRFMIATATLRYLGNTDDAAIYPSLFTTKVTNSDGDDLQFDGGMKADKDEDVPSDKRIHAGDMYTIRFYGQLPTTTTLKTFTISEGDSRRYVYDISDVH